MESKDLTFMTKEEKEKLVESVTDLALRDVLKREDMIEILKICRNACDRRIRRLKSEYRMNGNVQ